jgi:uncharacterized protein YndB with AHSA1/START domain
MRRVAGQILIAYDGSSAADAAILTAADDSCTRAGSMRRPPTVRTARRGFEMSNNARTSESLLSSLHSANGKGMVRVENVLDASVDDVWFALTEPGHLGIWLGEVEGDLRLGGRFRARFFASGWEGTGRVEVCEPPRRLVVLTKDADEPDAPEEHVIDVSLTAHADQTFLVWEERPMPINLLAAYGAGIQVHVEDLVAHLAGRERCDATARFDELFPAYQALAAGVGE